MEIRIEIRIIFKKSVFSVTNKNGKFDFFWMSTGQSSLLNIKRSRGRLQKIDFFKDLFRHHS